MFSNYIKIAWRTLWQNKVYSFINVGGLVLGLTVMMLIMVYVQDDLSFDRFHGQGAHIYRVVQDRWDGSDKIRKMGNTGFPHGPILKEEIPEILDYCRLTGGWQTLVKKGTEGLAEDLLYTDNAVLRMFSFQTLAGDPHRALQGLDQVVITDRMAKKYFPGMDPIGQMLEISDEGSPFKPFTVSAVVAHPPSNSSIQFDLLLSIQHQVFTDPEARAQQNDWHNASLNTFVLLNEQSDRATVHQKMAQVKDKYVAESLNAIEHGRKHLSAINLTLQPLYDMHLDAAYFATNGLQNWSDDRYPKILSVLGLIVLFIACINFVTLSLARSIKRIREIGVRKATGGSRQQLIGQFLSESFLFTVLSFLPAFALVHVALPGFGKLMDKHLENDYLMQGTTLAFFGVLLLLVAFLAGFYPAIVLSGFKPVDSLRGENKTGKKFTLTKTLIVGQFAVAIMLLIGTVIASQQFNFISKQPLGYKTENILRFWIPWEQIASIGANLKKDLMQDAHIEMVSAKSGDWNSTRFDINGAQTDWVYYEHIDDKHLQLMGIPLVKGRYLSYQYASDTISNIVVNESFVREYIRPDQDPFTTPIRQGDETSNIVGVVKDFHYASFKEKIKPIMWVLDKGSEAGCVHVQLKPGQTTAAVNNIVAAYKKYVPYQPMEYFFLEDFRMQKYAEELRWKKVLDYAAGCSLLIACLGLFGLAVFMTERRTKEIGVRKILGASIFSISHLLVRDFVKLVLVAVVIASPIAYYLVQGWLADFAYRIEVQWWMFAGAGLAALSVTLLTVGFQAVKVALTNPVKSLRNE